MHEDSLKLGGYVCIVGRCCLKLYSKDWFFLSQVPLAEAKMQIYSLLCPQLPRDGLHDWGRHHSLRVVFKGQLSVSFTRFLHSGCTRSTFTFCFLKLLFLSALFFLHGIDVLIIEKSF